MTTMATTATMATMASEVSLRHVLEQKAMLRALRGGAPLTDIAPPSDALIHAFVKYAGGDPAFYKGIIPPHLFSQWAVPVAFAAIAKTKYPLTRVMNAGCSLIQNAPLAAAAKSLAVKAELVSIDDDGHRAILTTRIVTSDALIAEINAFVRLKQKNESRTRATSSARTNPLVPLDAREIAFLRLGPHAGLDFAKLTGDFNPIHWVPAYARASGFRSTILHGFGTFAIAAEAIIRRVLSGNVSALRSMNARFTKPLVLPSNVGVFVTDEHEVFVGDALGAPAYLTGQFTCSTA